MSFLLVSVLLGLSTPSSTSSAPALPLAAAEISTSPEGERGMEDDDAVVEFRLDNGLTVLLSEAHDRSQVFGALVVRSGSRDDPADNTGMAHYLEHMLFKGTQRLGTTNHGHEEPLLAQIEQRFEAMRGAREEAREALRQEIDTLAQKAARYAIPNEVDRLLAELGGTDVNAFTHPDMTVYYNAFPGSQIESWLELTAERFADPVFRLFPSELETVYEEKNRAMDGFFVPAYEAFMRAFFPAHTYGTQSTLGEVEHLKRPSISAMKAFFETHYVAPNMALVLVGDFDSQAIRPSIEKALGRLPSGELPARSHGQVQAISGAQHQTVRVTPLRAGAVAFRTPVMGDHDYAATKILLALISNTQRTGLLDRLVAQGKLLMAMNFELDFHEHNGSILAFAPRLLTQSFADAERKILDALAPLADRPPDAALVDAGRDHVLRELQLRWEDHEQRALLLGDLTARGLRWEDFQSYVERLRGTVPADVQIAAQRYFGANRLHIRSRMGRAERTVLKKPEYTPLRPKEGRTSEYYKSWAASDPPSPRPRVVDFDRAITTTTVQPGVELRSNTNPFNDLERIELRFGLGDHDLPELVLLAEYLERTGSRDNPGAAFSDRLFSLSSTLDIFATPEAFVLRIEAPHQHMRSALHLIAELFEQPARDRRKLRRLRLENWATERALRAQPEVLAEALWESVVYGYYSRFRRMGARAQRRWSVRDLERAWSRVRTHALEVRVVGRRPLAEVAADLQATLSLPQEVQPAAFPRIRPNLNPQASRVVFLPRRGAVQTQIRIYVAGEAVPRARVPLRNAFDEYLGGGMAGLVFQEIREYRALAYVAHGGYRESRHAHYPGHTFIKLGCQADKTEEALNVAVSLLEAWETKSGRLPGLRRALAHRQETEDPFFRELQEDVQEWVWHGEISDPRPHWIQVYKHVEDTQIEDFWRQHVEGRPVVIMVVGDPRKVDRKMLERFAPVTTVRAGALYRP